jgi:hypothetical protein
MSSFRSDASRSSSIWLLELAVRASPSSNFGQPFEVATQPFVTAAIENVPNNLERNSCHDLAGPGLSAGTGYGIDVAKSAG